MRSLLLAALLVADLALFYPSSVSVRGSACIFLFMLPGFALGQALLSSSADRAIRLGLSLGAAFLFALLCLFVLSSLPGFPKSSDILLILNFLSVAAVWRCRAPIKGQRLSREELLAFAIVVLAALLRLPALGSAELQGDEARAVILASGVSSAAPDIIFMHKKGPAEALFAAPSLFLTGNIDEFVARLPFSLAGIAAILGIFSLVRSMTGDRYRYAALFAAGLLSIDGFHVAFSRIVQYQSLLVFFLLCALQCAFEARRSVRSAHQYASACAAFCAAALLCHYDAALAFPAIAYVLWTSLAALGFSRGAILRSLLFPAFQFLVLTAVFYAPFLLNEQFANTAGYLSQRVGVNKLPTNNLPRYLHLSAFYGGIYQTYFIYGLLAAGIALWLKRYVQRPFPVAVGMISLLLLLTEASTAWAFLLFAIPIIFLLTAPATPLHLRPFILWSAIGLGVLGFFFARPNTHFYVIHAANAVLAAFLLAEYFEFVQRNRALHMVSWIVVAAICTLSINYLRLVFLTPNIEYRFAYSKIQPLLFPAPPENLPAGAFFGFQHRSGWKAVGDLIQRGTLQGSYDSNEEDLITVWYTRGAARVAENPDFYFVAVRPMDPVKISRTQIENEYVFWGRVYADNRRVLDIFSRERTGSAAQRFDLQDHEAAFDAGDARVLDARRVMETAVSR